MRSGCQLACQDDRLLPAARLPHHVEAVLLQQGGERIPGQRMVVDDEDPLGHALRGFCR